MSRQVDDPIYDFDHTADAWSEPLLLKTGNTPTPNDDRTRGEQLHQLSLLLHQPDDEMYTPPQRHLAQESNQRQYCRCPIPDDQSRAILTLNGRRFHCQLVELSIGGFGVILTGNPQLEAGAVGTLISPSLSYVVGVTRQEHRPDGTYIGLKQIEEIVDRDSSDRRSSTVAGYMIAGLSGALIAIASYYFMNGN